MRTHIRGIPNNCLPASIQKLPQGNNTLQSGFFLIEITLCLALCAILANTAALWRSMLIAHHETHAQRYTATTLLLEATAQLAAFGPLPQLAEKMRNTWEITYTPLSSPLKKFTLYLITVQHKKNSHVITQTVGYHAQ